MASTAVQSNNFFSKKKGKLTARQSVIDSWASSICLGADLAHITTGLSFRPSMTVLRCESWLGCGPAQSARASDHGGTAEASMSLTTPVSQSILKKKELEYLSFLTKRKN